MGKNTDQIATWYDLQTYLGYRLPYGAENDLHKCVTYVDLYNCQRGYLPEYYTNYQNASDAEKRLHTTQNTYLSAVFGISGFTCHLTITNDVGPYSAETSKSNMLYVSNGRSDRKEVTCYTFTSTRDFDKTSITWNNFQFWVVCNISGTLHGVITIQEDVTGKVISQGSIDQPLTSTTSKQQLTISTGLDNISELRSGVDYRIVISFYVMTSVNLDSSGNGLLNPGQTSFIIPITFYRSDQPASFSLASYIPEQTGLQGQKCVRYDQIKANTKATVPVFIQVKNTYGTYINADYVRFRYYYKLPNTDWKYITTGEVNWNKISANTTVSTTLDVLINPVAEEVESDYLEIYFGAANSNKDMAWTVYSGDSVVQSGSDRSAEVFITGRDVAYAGQYRDYLTRVTHIHYSVN